MRFLRFAVLACAAIVSTIFAAHADEPLTIASEGARPPYNYLDNNELAGFEIDLGRELCTRMRRTCTFVSQDWDSLLPGLLARQYDAVMAAIDITDERRAQVAFSNPYVQMPVAFVVAKTASFKDSDPTSFVGKTIGVEDGSAAQAFAEEHYKAATVRTFATLEDAMLDLAEGKIDALMAEALPVADFLSKRREGQCCKVLGYPARDVAVFGDGIGVALRKNDVALREAINAALQAMIEDGTFAAISQKYFSFSVRERFLKTRRPPPCERRPVVLHHGSAISRRRARGDNQRSCRRDRKPGARLTQVP